jgi:hypothetical protein
MDERERETRRPRGRAGNAAAGSSFPERGNGMRIDRQGDVARRRQALMALDGAKLAQAKGGLKAERVQGSDPSLPGGESWPVTS